MAAASGYSQMKPKFAVFNKKSESKDIAAMLILSEGRAQYQHGTSAKLGGNKLSNAIRRLAD
jgi:hypothetical protein